MARRRWTASIPLPLYRFSASARGCARADSSARIAAPVLSARLNFTAGLGVVEFKRASVAKDSEVPREALFSEYFPNVYQRAVVTRPCRGKVGLPGNSEMFQQLSGCVELIPVYRGKESIAWLAVSEVTRPECNKVPASDRRHGRDVYYVIMIRTSGFPSECK